MLVCWRQNPAGHYFASKSSVQQQLRRFCRWSSITGTVWARPLKTFCYYCLFWVFFFVDKLWDSDSLIKLTQRLLSIHPSFKKINKSILTCTATVKKRVRCCARDFFFPLIHVLPMSLWVSLLSLVFVLQNRVKQVGLIGSPKDFHRCQNVNACCLEVTDELNLFIFVAAVVLLCLISKANH